MPWEAKDGKCHGSFIPEANLNAMIPEGDCGSQNYGPWGAGLKGAGGNPCIVVVVVVVFFVSSAHGTQGHGSPEPFPQPFVHFHSQRGSG